MDVDKRNELIDRYYLAADEEDYDRLTSVFTEDVEYRYPGENDMHGVGEVREFFEERRQTTGTTHDVFRRLHDDEATVCEGHITGELRGEGPFEGSYVGVFEFDEAGEAISHVSVYTQL